ncbi:MAG: chemotaxis protein CheW, partial [Gammaproteobacteria bacterium]|nr:chemotaxis protein CheW [Gammaproteobacteria bacterium]
INTAMSETTTAGAPELRADVLEKTFNAISAKGDVLVKRFYAELFRRFPRIQSMFTNTTPEHQQAKLLGALRLVVENVRNPDKLIKTLTELGLRHQEYGAEPVHYDAVISTFIDVFREVAGDTWNDEAETAWFDALTIIARVMQDSYLPDAAVMPAESLPAAEKLPAAAAARQPVEKRKSAGGEASSIRVSIDKVDELINTVGELVITQSMLGQFGEMEELNSSHLEKLRDGLAQLERNTRELQEAVMRIRMLPISFAFQRFPRLVHDLSAQLGKKVELKMSGEGTELDKTVMEKIGDPLVHLVRNSMDHGIEAPDVRRSIGKSEMGVLHLNAYHQGGNIVIEIIDDGAGLNREKILAKARKQHLIQENETLTEEQIGDLIFQPGFSTADTISDVSGRGVGMDVVRKNIRSLGGTVDVKSIEGQGTTFTIRLPLTLAILDGQLIRVGNETYIIPLVSIVESVQLDEKRINIVSGRGEVYKLRDDYIPIVRLYHIFAIPFNMQDEERGLLVVVEAEGEKIALFVDELLGQQQVVIKSLETNFRKVEGLSGATILGDGTVALILDVKGLFDLNSKVATRPEFVFRNSTRNRADDSSDEPGIAASGV